MDCEEWTSYSNIENKSGKIECPECKNHEIDTKLCLDMLVNKEIIKRKLIELSFEDIVEVNYSAELDNQFDVTINKIDLECESAIKEINDYRDSLFKKLNEKKMNLINQMKKLNLKITIIADFKSSRENLEKEIKQNKHELKVPNDRLKLVEELIGKLDLVSVPNEKRNHFFQTEPDYSNQTNILISKEMVHTLIYGNENQQLNVTHHFRKLMSKGSNLPIDQVINTGIVPKLVEFLQRNNHQLQIEAIWILTNIASGNSLQTGCVIEAGALPILVQLLSSSSKNVQVQAVWTLGNITGDSPQSRDLVLDHGIVPPLLHILSQQMHLNLTRSAVWCLSNLCRSKNSKVESALTILATLLSNPDVDVLADATRAISHLSDGADAKIQKIINIGVCPRLVELLKHSSQNVIQAALKHHCWHQGPDSNGLRGQHISQAN
ncbi:importin subunit alpha-7-like [Brachionus plicatilis]|uniref:Importin subunit alpha-7-like n=1 Tax=Brachionus plicatilis TaxID=10195 RepID=A0A3M7SMS9_BRAPC|nr:importin subunit alpha-7-like [Brachionus plicatilis]